MANGPTLASRALHLGKDIYTQEYSMVKIEILTDPTVEGLQKQITDWASNG